MSMRGALERLGRMDRHEIAFRLTCEARKRIGRVRHAVAPATWHRRDLPAVLTVSIPAAAEAAQAAARGDYGAAQRVLASHFATRASVWPLQARHRVALVDEVTARFPSAAQETQQAADRVLRGAYDLLGYRGVEYGVPPDWHRDAVHGRQAPSAAYWASIAYLDPRHGDHKVIWELNRHQHFGVLGRAWWLTGDERYRTAFVNELESWLAANPPLTGINWASMLELGFRSLSWTWAVEFFSAGAETSHAPWLVDLLVALDRQLTHIAHNLSRYFSPNTHLSGEALALFAVSLAFPELRNSARYAALGREVLLQETQRQIRADGGHAELSAHYHRYSTDFYLLATQAARAAHDPAAGALERATRVQAEYLRTIADDRGHLPLIGDDDGGQLFRFCGGEASDASPTLAAAASVLDAPTLSVGVRNESIYWILGEAPSKLVSGGTPAAWPSRVLGDSGYFVSRSSSGDHLLFDAGPHGFLNGGHAHADALSVVLTVNGKPFLVDPGTATYTMDPAARDRFRSSRMHNTVVLDGRDHADPRGPFHWSGHPDARFTVVQTDRRVDAAQGTHDAYPGVRHVRTVVALQGVGWLFVDQVLGSGGHEAEAWWHIHPDWALTADGARVECRHADGTRLLLASASADVEIIRDDAYALYAPEYGRIERAPLIRMRRAAAAPFSFATFVPARFSGETVSIDVLPIDAPPPGHWTGAAFAIDAGYHRVNVLTAATVDGTVDRLPEGHFWGTSGIQTDGPLAIAWVDRGVVRTHALAGTVCLGGNLASAVHDERAAGF